MRLGFTWGVKLRDPDGRLIGDSNQIRHIKLYDLSPLDDPYVRDLIAQAMAIAPNSDGVCEPQTIIKVMNGPKRRPKPF